jgi:membrane protein DedA with SNARE-associated domain
MLGVIIGVLIEAIIAPIPSPVIYMTAGLVLIEPELALGAGIWKILWLITIPAALACTVGNYIVYFIAYYGGKPLVDRFHKLLDITWKDVLRVKKKFTIRNSEALSLVVLRALPIMPISVISAAAGAIKLDWKKFGLFSLIGLLPRIFLLAFIGWKMSQAYGSIASHINNAENLVTYTFIALIALAFIVHKLKIIPKIEQWVTK